jgi:hypothetical protein
MENKPKKCNGIRKANGFIGCGIETLNREHGLCSSCRYDFYTTDERGKIEFFKRKIQVTSKREKVFKSDLRQKLKTLGQFEVEAKKSFQKYVRIRDAELNCISCNGNEKGLWDGGHFFKAELFSGLIFDERNCHKQCRKCNRFLNGNELQYRFGLIKRHGLEYVEKLESISNENRVYKYTKEELIEIKKKYDAKIKES